MCCSEVVSDVDNDITDAKRAKIWKILKDTLSGKIKGYGTFPKKYVSEYDSDIGKLIEITNRINY